MMKDHTKIQKLLYDFLTDELSNTDRDLIRQHLASCKICSAKFEQMQSTVGHLDSIRTNPSDERPALFWQGFADRVMDKIDVQHEPSRVSTWIDEVRTAFTLHKGYALGLAGSLAILVLAFSLRQWSYISDDGDEQFVSHPAAPVEYARADSVGERFGQYLQKSKILFVGLINTQADENGRIDLSLERSASRELVHEARFLREQPLDRRSDRLIRDLQKILVELANAEETEDIPNVELIRSGIDHQNLLFKIRMAEAAFDSTTMTRARYIY